MLKLQVKLVDVFQTELSWRNTFHCIECAFQLGWVLFEG